MTPKRLPKTNPQVLFTELADGTGVLLHLDTKFYFTLNATGVIVWKSLGEAVADEDAIASRIEKEFRVDHATALADVASMLAEMLENELLVDTK